MNRILGITNLAIGQVASLVPRYLERWEIGELSTKSLVLHIVVGTLVRVKEV